MLSHRHSRPQPMCKKSSWIRGTKRFVLQDYPLHTVRLFSERAPKCHLSGLFVNESLSRVDKPNLIMVDIGWVILFSCSGVWSLSANRFGAKKSPTKIPEWVPWSPEVRINLVEFPNGNIPKNIHRAARTLSIKDGIGGLSALLVGCSIPKPPIGGILFIQVVEYAMSIKSGS